MRVDRYLGIMSRCVVALTLLFFFGNDGFRTDIRNGNFWRVVMVFKKYIHNSHSGPEGGQNLNSSFISGIFFSL